MLSFSKASVICVYVCRCASVCPFWGILCIQYAYGYLYVNVCMCECVCLYLPMQIYMCFVYLVCCLYLCSSAAQFQIHQSVLSPCFGSPSLSVKDVTQRRIHHSSSIQQSVRLFKFACMPLQLLFSYATSHPANVTGSPSTA